MDWIPVAKVAYGPIGGNPGDVNNDKNNKKLEAELRSHLKDIQDVTQKAQEIATLNIKGLTDLRGYVTGKQSSLARRQLIPQDLRAEGNKFYSETLLLIHQRIQK